MDDNQTKKGVNFQLMIFIMIMVLYILIIVVLLEIIYFERTLVELVNATNNMGEMISEMK